MVVHEGRCTIPDFNFNEGDNMNEEEPPNPDAKKFYDMLEAANEPLWDGCEKHTKLSLVARLMSIKAENRMSEKCYDQIAELMKEIAPENNEITRNFYSSKKLLRGMGLPAEKIDCFENGCILYWGDDLIKLCCKICDHPRYKWKHVRQNKEHMDMYFNEFKKFYRWNEHDEAIKKIFIRHGGHRYSDMLCNMKKNKDRMQPGAIGDESWALFKAYWDKQDTKDNAAKMAQNRLSEPEGAGTGIYKHCGGSRSARGHAMLLKKELGREPTYYELMERTHVKADKSGFCTEKARRIAEEIEAREIAFQERGEEVDPNEIFMEVVPVNKQRLFGTGSVGSSRVSKNVVSSSSSQSQGESESLRHQLDSLSAQLEEERVLRTQRELEIQEQLANSKR
ncbi:hypothetical protein OROMI_009245 [Orobanche minor]